MNFNSLSSNEKLAVYGSVAVIIGLLVASSGFFGFGLSMLALLAAIGMLVVVFLPQMSAGTSLPGSKGTLMVILGGVAAAILVLTLITYISFLGALLGSLNGILFLVAVIGSVVMAWAGWQELQSEGGSFRVGTGGTGTTTRSTTTPPPAATPGAASTSTTWTDTSAAGHTTGDEPDARNEDLERPSNR